MTEKRFTSFKEDDGYWVRDEHSFRIIATGLKFGVAENLCAVLNNLVWENEQLKQQLKKCKEDYILETYSDNPVRRDEKLRELKRELEND